MQIFTEHHQHINGVSTKWKGTIENEDMSYYVHQQNVISQIVNTCENVI